jgi:hypothetical protein
MAQVSEVNLEATQLYSARDLTSYHVTQLVEIIKTSDHSAGTRGKRLHEQILLARTPHPARNIIDCNYVYALDQRQNIVHIVPHPAITAHHVLESSSWSLFLSYDSATKS